MTKPDREPVKQSQPSGRQFRTHVEQSTRSTSHLKTPAAGRREPVNQSQVKK
jgi:hypothetical protein